MLNQEFDSWLVNHTNAHPELAAWLKKGTNSSVLEFWKAALEKTLLSDAKDVTRRMAIGELDEPKGFSKHGAFVARQAREASYSRQSKSTAIDGEPVYVCKTCFDEGLVAVVDPVAYRAGQFRACSTYCTCHMGDLKQNRKFSDGRRAIVRPRFDAAKMFLLNYDMDTNESHTQFADCRAQFETWLDSRVPEPLF